MNGREFKTCQESPFSGLDEKELHRLYQLASIRKVDIGEVLIREGDTDQTVYVVLEGTIDIVKNLSGRPERVAEMGSGAWVGEIAFTKLTPRTASVVAGTPGRVMVITKATLQAMTPETQLYFFRRLNDLANERIRRLESREQYLTGKNDKLMDYIHAVHFGEAESYRQSDMIQGIIKKIPRLPVFPASLAADLLKGRMTTREVAEHVKENPALTAMVMDAVNSSFYGLASPFNDIHHAILQLGFNEVYLLILSDGLRATMPDRSAYHTILSHSVAVSHLAFVLCRETNKGQMAKVATLGLMHDLGRGVVQLLKEKNKNLAMLIDAMDPARLGAVLLREWGMPELLCRSVEHQRLPEFTPPHRIPDEIRIDVSLLYLAHLCTEILKGCSQADLPTTFLEDYLGLIDWPEGDLETLVRIRLLPALTRHMNTYPVSFRTLLENFSKPVEDSV